VIVPVGAVIHQQNSNRQWNKKDRAQRVQRNQCPARLFGASKHDFQIKVSSRQRKLPEGFQVHFWKNPT
jgi:hypothetical protein